MSAPVQATESSPPRSVSAILPDTFRWPKLVEQSVRFVGYQTRFELRRAPAAQASPSSSCLRAFLWKQGGPTGSFPLRSPTVRRLLDTESSPPGSVGANLGRGHVRPLAGTSPLSKEDKFRPIFEPRRLVLLCQPRARATKAGVILSDWKREIHGALRAEIRVRDLPSRLIRLRKRRFLRVS